MAFKRIGNGKLMNGPTEIRSYNRCDCGDVREARAELGMTRNASLSRKL